ncbi:hypothetical protein C2S52_006814 [Perilla frutescens var. hirtella]|nr:hypothetical protein C2S52_006814 [Perilla frutescens var. hirtella]
MAANVASVIAGWRNWTLFLPSSTQIFLGLPASPFAVDTGYIGSEQLVSEIMPVIGNSPNYGGVMMWNRYFDLIYAYSGRIFESVCSSNSPSISTFLFE